MSTTIRHELTLECVDCCVCGVTFTLPDKMMAQRRKDKELFYCPSGHPQQFTRSEADKLRDQLEEKQRQLTESRCTEANATRAKIAAESELVKLKTRARNGVCFCCHRTFKNLARHMKTKHSQPKKNETPKTEPQ